MFQQLTAAVMTRDGVDAQTAAETVLRSDPLDLVLYMEQLWMITNPTIAPQPARQQLLATGAYSTLPVAFSWDHLGYSYVIENTRGVQIFRRVVREFRSGEALGEPSADTARWLDATETLLFGAQAPLSAWLSTSTVRPDAEMARRNAYFRIGRFTLAFEGEDNQPAVFARPEASNTGFVPLFEELLYELWQAISNLKNFSGVNQTDDDRIYRIAQELKYMLRVRRQGGVLDRIELAASVVAGWVDLTLSFDSAIVRDLRAQATSPDERLALIGHRVGLAAHSKSSNFFAMAADLSTLLRLLEIGAVDSPEHAWLLYAISDPGGSGQPGFGEQSRRVITEWSAASGKNLKQTSVPTRVVAAQPKRPVGQKPSRPAQTVAVRPERQRV